MKLTPQDIENEVAQVRYFNWDTLTICVLELQNGFKVVGTSACADPAEYNEQIGQELAYKKALDKVWELEGYMLRAAIWSKQNVTKEEAQEALAAFLDS